MKSYKWQHSSTREEVEKELIRLRELEEAAYARLRQEEAMVRALKKELDVMISLKDPQGDGEEQLRIASKRKLLEEQIESRLQKVEELTDDSKRAYMLTRRQTGMRSAFAESEERVAKATVMRAERRKFLGPWKVVQMRVKDVVDLGEAGYGKEKRRRELLDKARHVLQCEKSLQNSLVFETKKAVSRLKEVDAELALRPPPVASNDDDVEQKTLPPLKEIVETVFNETKVLMALRGTFKAAEKDKAKWERSKEDNAAGMLISTNIRISILEEQLAEQQRVLNDKEEILAAVRARIERGGEETSQEKYQREKYERDNLIAEKMNHERKWSDCESAVRKRFMEVGELRREQEQAKSYQNVAGKRLAEVSGRHRDICKWQRIAIEVKRALENERDGLKWQVKNNNELTPDVRLAMQEKVDAMINQLVEEKQKAIELTEEKEELEREIDLLETRIKRSKDDVAY